MHGCVNNSQHSIFNLLHVFQFNAPLYFASAGVFRSQLYIETEINPGEVGMCKTQGCFHSCGDKVG